MTESDPSATQAATPDQNRRSADISGAFQPTPAPTGERYEFRDLLATGGMGAVYHAWDTHLKRDIAVKLIHGTGAASDLVRRRFGHEASITAQLQHPGIPPVYDQGVLADGRPFLAMKLVKGKTLDDLLKGRPDPAHDRGRFVATFEAVGHAVGYAHSKGVLHRDLKPLNVMVGAFGEVQVMDWGLAKFRGDATDLTAESAAASTFFDPRADDDSKTSAGSFLGTPAYMPPEQAAGAVETVTERSDVFGLGAILCTILTGHPPFRGSTGESTRLLAAQGKVEDAFARLDACGAEPELVALAKRCLAVDPARRPANGSVVADEVAQLRAAAESRAKQAEVAKAASDTRRRVLAWSAAAVVVTLAAGVGLAIWQAVEATDAKNYAQGQATLATNARIAADGQRALAERAKEQAVQAQTVAQRRYALAIGVLRKFVRDTDATLDTNGVPGPVRLGLLRSVEENLHLTLAEADPNDRDAQKLRAEYHSKLGDLRLETGQKAGAKAEYDTALQLAQRLADEQPSDADGLLYLGLCLERIGRWHRDDRAFAAALAAYQQSLAVRKRLGALDPGAKKTIMDTSATWVKIGLMYVELDEPGPALHAVLSADATLEPLVRREPKNPKALREKVVVLDAFGFVHHKLKNDRKALAALKQAGTIVQTLVAADPSNPSIWLDLATIARRTATTAGYIPADDDALAAYRQQCDALHEYQKLVANHPTAVDRREELVLSYVQMGILLAKQKEYADALRAYEFALAFRTTLLAEKPGDRLQQVGAVALLVDFPAFYLGLSDQKTAANDPAGAAADRAEAERRYRAAIAAYAKLPPPPADQAPQDLAVLKVLFGRAFLLDQRKDALDWATKWVRLAKATPGLPAELRKEIPQFEQVVAALEADQRPK